MTYLVDVTKKQRQEQGIEVWRRNGGKGTLNHVMRFGKTEEGCMVIEKLLTSKPDASIIITTASDTVANVWRNYIPDYFARIQFTSSSEEYIERVSKHVQVIPIAQLINMQRVSPTRCTLLIVDEIHKFVSDARFMAISTLQHKYILGLTGTYPSGEDKRAIDSICPIIDIITEEEALAKKWINPFIEYNIMLELPQVDKVRYAAFTTPMKETLELFRGSRLLFRDDLNEFIFKDDYDVINSCFRGKKYLNSLGKIEYFTGTAVRHSLAELKGWHRNLDITNTLSKQIDDYWNPVAIEQNVRLFMSQQAKRNEILINHPVKLAAVLEIYRLSPVTTICFNESTDFADVISNAINANFGIGRPISVVYHSNISSRPLLDPTTKEWITYKTGNKKGEIKLFGKDTLKSIAIEGLRREVFTFLSTARALDEGLDVPNLQQVITTAGTANPIQYKQRTARGKTLDIYNPNKLTKIFNLCFDNFRDPEGELVKSRDLSKLSYRQKDNFVTPITIDGIERIKDYINTT